LEGECVSFCGGDSQRRDAIGKSVKAGRLTLDAVLLFDFRGRVLSLFFPPVVPDGHVGAGFGESLGDSQSNVTCAGTGYNGGLALEGEEGEDTVRLGSHRGVVDKLSVFHVRHVYGYVLGNGLVRTCWRERREVVEYVSNVRLTARGGGGSGMQEMRYYCS
jgi:hypothetical protein